MKELKRTLKFNFKGEDYEISVPTVGEYLDIENQKIIQSDGHWVDLLKNQTMSSLHSIQIISCVSILIVLCPKLFANMKVTSYKQIDAIDFIELLSVYTNEVGPWYSAWFENFNEIIVEANKKTSEFDKEEK